MESWAGENYRRDSRRPFKKAKATATMRGESLKDFVTEALQEHLNRKTAGLVATWLEKLLRSGTARRGGAGRRGSCRGAGADRSGRAAVIPIPTLSLLFGR